ncbi:MAG: MarR family transcriptional regulator [Alphaproteobacteria bacterium]
MSGKGGGEGDRFAHAQATGYLLARAHGLVRARMSAALEGGPLHLGHVLILSTLIARNDLTQAQLTQMAGIEKSSVVLFIDALEKDGWVERQPHPTDRRAHRVHLTREGRARFREVGKKLAAAEREALAALRATEQRTLQELLLKLIEDSGNEARK